MRLAIDPGLDTGWALFSDERALLSCGLGDPPAIEPGTSVIIERPQVYEARRSPGDPNDLITLAIQVGRYTERMHAQGASTVSHVLPRAWKGTLDPDVICRRAANCLSSQELELLHAALRPLARRPLDDVSLSSGKRHNVLDAVGLGRWSFLRGRPGIF